MYNLYLYDEIIDSFDSERSAFEYVREVYADYIEELRATHESLADATDEYIISTIVYGGTDGLALEKE